MSITTLNQAMLDNVLDLSSHVVTLPSATVQSTTNVVNVKAFGAIGNGVIDDTAAINAALAAATGTGGLFVVYFPVGTYLISSTISILNNTFVTGAGRASVIMAANNSIDIFNIIGTANLFDNISTLNGNAALRLYGSTSECTNNIVRNFYSNLANYGIVLDGYTNTNNPCYWNNFHDCLIERPKIHGVYLTLSGAGDTPNANKFHRVRVYSKSNAMTGCGFYVEYGKYHNSFVDCDANIYSSAFACFRAGAQSNDTLFINPHAESKGGVYNVYLDSGSVGTAISSLGSQSAGSAIKDYSGGSYTTFNSGYPVKNLLSLTSITDLTIGAMRFNSQYISGNTAITLDLSVPFYKISSASGATTVTLPNANSTSPNASGSFVYIEKLDNSSNSITIVEASPGNGPNQKSLILASQYDYCVLYCNGATWDIVGNNNPPINTLYYTTGGTFNPDMQRAVYKISAAASATSVVLPPANTATAIGRLVTFMKTDSSTNAVTLTVSDGSNIGGYINYLLPAQYNAVTVLSDGSNWVYINALGQYYFPIHTTGAMVVDNTATLNGTTAINGTLNVTNTTSTFNGAGGTTAATSATASFGGGATPTASNIYSMQVTKTGTQQFMMGINRNAATGTVPSNSCFISTYTSSGTIALGRGNSAGNPNTVDLYIDGSGNICVGGTGSVGGGVKVISIASATTLPTTNPTGGGILYVDSGILKYRGSSGTVTQIAPA